jgi:hypothetical protein
VTLSEPVDATLSLRMTLTEAWSEENEYEALPTNNPVVTVARRLPPTRWLPLHKIAVSDSHSLISQLLAPRRIPPLSTETPRPELCTVTLDDPLDPAFCTLDTLKLVTETENTSVVLPADPPALTTMRRDLLAACARRHRKLVSDSHSVLAQAENPTRKDSDIVPCPNPLPNTVTLSDPDDGKFADQTTPEPVTRTYMLGPSKLKSALALPTTKPADRDTFRDASKPCPPRHLALVSDTHSLCSHALIPTAMRKLEAQDPTFMP